MDKPSIWLRGVFAMLLVPICFVLAAGLSLFFIPDNEGFAGAATVAMSGLGGAFLGLLGGIVLSAQLPKKLLVRANYVLLVVVIVLVALFT